MTNKQNNKKKMEKVTNKLIHLSNNSRDAHKLFLDLNLNF